MSKNKSLKLPSVLLLIILISLLTLNLSANSQALAEDINRIQLREDFQQLLYDYDSSELQEVFTSEYLEKLKVDGPEDLIDRQEYITIEEAIADTEFLFKTLKYGYAGYQFFGGDQRFNTAETNIIKSLEEEGTPEEKIKVDKLDSLINSELDFIKDNHFRVGQTMQGVDYRLFYNEDLKFNKEITDAGEINYIEKDTGHKFQGIAGYELEESIWPFIDRDGNKHYHPGLLLEMTEIEELAIAKDLQLKSDQEYTEEISLTKIKQQENESRLESSEKEKIYKKTEINGIPAIKLRSLHPTDSNQKAQLNQFLSDARNLREYDKLIIDLRWNAGGSPQFAGRWLQRFTGRYVGNNQVEAYLRTEASYRLMKNNLWQYPPESLQRFKTTIENNFSPLSHRGWSDIKIDLTRELENDTELIVLTNSQTISAGEFFIRYLRQLENVTFIGSNTKGSLLIGGVTPFILNNSGIRVGVGTRINLEPDLINREGRGYLPDFWLEFPDNLEEINFNNI